MQNLTRWVKSYNSSIPMRLHGVSQIFRDFGSKNLILHWIPWKIEAKLMTWTDEIVFLLKFPLLKETDRFLESKFVIFPFYNKNLKKGISRLVESNNSATNDGWSMLIWQILLMNFNMTFFEWNAKKNDRTQWKSDRKKNSPSWTESGESKVWFPPN